MSSSPRIRCAKRNGRSGWRSDCRFDGDCGAGGLFGPDLEAHLDAYTQFANVAAVRQHLGWDANNPRRCMATRGDLLTDSVWRQGVRLLKKYNFKCSLEVFSPQLPELLAVIRENPETGFTIAVMGWPVPADDEEFARWRRSMAAIAACENVRVAISALECVFGMDWSVAQAHLGGRCAGVVRDRAGDVWEPSSDFAARAEDRESVRDICGVDAELVGDGARCCFPRECGALVFRQPAKDESAELG